MWAAGEREANIPFNVHYSQISACHQPDGTCLLLTDLDFKMKRTWEYAVAGFFLFFVLGILAVVFFTLGDRNYLVTEHYDAEILYQQQIDRIERTRALPEQPTIRLTDAGIFIVFPRSFRPTDLTGTVRVYRPDDKLLDITLPVGPDSDNAQLIPIGLLSSGTWKVQAAWNGRGIGYYSEARVAIGGDQK
jgi:hypothetical protein